MKNSQTTDLHKDATLDRLANTINVAQFVSFKPQPKLHQNYSRVLGYEPNHVFANLRDAICRLLERSPENSVNVRSFKPNDPRSHEFIYGLTNIGDIENAILRINQSGLHVILNETVDVKDGGVSGVIQGDTIEFSPDDTPRCVEKPGTTSLPSKWGISLLKKVYGLPIETLNLGSNFRLEFSIHPKPRGWKNTHILGWELEEIDEVTISPAITWPNQFSKLIGDKAFGLLIASEIGLRVPKSTVISRRLAPFSFGEQTRSLEWWIRTCPKEQVPGKFTTNRGWLDPFVLMAHEDPTGTQISSVIAQSGVPSVYSGALIVSATDEIIIEGRAGEGEALMKGTAFPEKLPEHIIDSVTELYNQAKRHLGPVRLEWVHDGIEPWVLQLHRGATMTQANIVVPGEAENWRQFDVSLGLEKLRQELQTLSSNEGMLLKGQIGLTSHIADVIRKAGRPARII